MMYDKNPEIFVNDTGQGAFQGYDAICDAILEKVSNGRGRVILTLDCYPGVNVSELEQRLIGRFSEAVTIYSDDLTLDSEEIEAMISRNLTDDRVFGVMSHHRLREFFDEGLLAKARGKIEQSNGLVIIYGVGAHIVHQPDVLVYADMTRWEIQRRFSEEGLNNWKSVDLEEDMLKKFKRGYFFEWRVADRHKKTLFDEIDFLLDTSLKEDPKMVTGELFRWGMKKALTGPFRLVPYFAPGVWGGQWMKERFELDPDSENYAWSFDGVPEENSVQMRFGDIRISMPAVNLVYRHPVELLGDRVHARFGDEFPIRFDFLDTMGGQNLSLQVHPVTEYIQDRFGMHYTQDESYYMLDAKEAAVVYLGVKEGVDPNAMEEELQQANAGGSEFRDEAYINRFQVKKHDHILIPAGTIHCSGRDTVVLEISATPYIFTFKLWDWGRLGMDGKPRPVHLEHGMSVVDWERDTAWVQDQLLNRIEEVGKGDGWVEERTGLHEREFIETRRHWFSGSVTHSTDGSVNMLNLVEGQEAIVESPDGSFNPYVIHYGETFIVPANVKRYTIRPYGRSEGETLATIKASVRI
ncbi:class I mannose-6-phosphate isomerase (plasmid) [Rossellomorea sp. FS2]|uniref:class I mannose-6-phosphate isomerase n=1 Tax=Rossellomorea sp. FS2 TaxID=3391447 RepID=UPI003A4E519D